MDDSSCIIANIDKKKIRKEVRKTCAERRKITLLKDVKIRMRFEEKVIELIDTGAPNLWGHMKDEVLDVFDEVLNAFDEVCGRRGGGEVKEILGGGMKR